MPGSGIRKQIGTASSSTFLLEEWMDRSHHSAGPMAGQGMVRSAPVGQNGLNTARLPAQLR